MSIEIEAISEPADELKGSQAMRVRLPIGDHKIEIYVSIGDAGERKDLGFHSAAMTAVYLIASGNRLYAPKE